ncbi:MAG: tRNA (adenosine(37)-N6)-threonylcarbamoyltransferase complex ATPase subunit type 1 TsaE [Myxococcota bacterium]
MSAGAWSVSTRDARATRRLACRIGADARPGTVLALAGDLGAGKTTFVQGIAEGVGVEDVGQVLSPTYTLVNEYPAGALTLIHIDLYRLNDAAGARALGIEEQIARSDAIVAVEWADHMPELIPMDAAWIRFSWDEGNARTITVEGLAKPPSRRR